jgi:hypothetical protein
VTAGLARWQRSSRRWASRDLEPVPRGRALFAIHDPNSSSDRRREHRAPDHEGRPYHARAKLVTALAWAAVPTDEAARGVHPDGEAGRPAAHVVAKSGSQHLGEQQHRQPQHRQHPETKRDVPERASERRRRLRAGRDLRSAGCGRLRRRVGGWRKPFIDSIAGAGPEGDFQQTCTIATTGAPLVGQDCRKASRSALIVSASVVGIPCGNPL